MSSSLYVHDPRSRGRSKSPGGRNPDRSRSRDSRIPPPAPVTPQYYTSGHPENSRREMQPPSSNAHSRGTYEKSSRYDHSDSERERYGTSQQHKDRYYHSDSDDDKVSRDQGLSRTSASSRYQPLSDDDEEDDRRHHRPSRTHRSPSTDSDNLITEDALAYGDDLSDTYTRPLRELDDHSRSLNISDAPPTAGVSYRGDLDSEQRTHPSYAKPEQFSYARPEEYTPGGPPRQPSQPSYTAAPAIAQPAWAPRSESQVPTQTIPGAFPSSTTGPPYPNTGPGSIPMSHQTYEPPQWHYADADPNSIKYKQKPQYMQGSTSQYVGPYGMTSESQITHPRQSSEPQLKSYAQSVELQLKPHTQGGGYQQKPYTQSHDAKFVEITPGHGKSESSSHGRPHGLSVSSANNLTVSGLGVGARPPPSPLLEAYKGTYQSISPMPSPLTGPLTRPSRSDDDISDMEALDAESGSERRIVYRTTSREERDVRDRRDKEKDRERKLRDDHYAIEDSRGSRDEVNLVSPGSKKRVSFYDPTADAIALKQALSHRTVDTKPLLTILPYLTSHDILTLRAEYKNHAKVQGKGINIAKHIKMKLGSTNLGKVCYATALGRWESEAFWANYYYQAGTSRRELLIETLMGRSNSDIREIKECFRDSRYSDSLERCMKAELKADKFRIAILLALEAKRQSDHETLDMRLVHRDAQDLHSALVSREGGETAMINIILVRSDTHLREVLHVYEKAYEHNFAKAMISKSKNLVGETLTHILNGALNRPMRDALLLHQAISESRSGRERSELLISRLVRLHWEPRHLERVKHEYRKRYRERVEEAIAQEVIPSSGSEWGEFCIELARSSAVHTRRAAR